ncbi:MAG: SDR family oxidoreductase [Chloroflexi bacterium]|nr:SDR family oxidoreductase [Chloroflexota bacterium]
MILVVGASSTLGSVVARRLLEKKKAVRAMSRTPEKIADIEQVGAQVVQGDLRDPDSLRRACDGATTVIASAHSLLGRGDERSELVDDKGHRDLIDAAQEAGVQHFVYISGMFAAPDHPVPFARYKYNVEQYLKASGLDYTIIRASAFMETHAHEMIGKPILEKGQITLLGKGQSPRNFVAVKDVTQFVLLALENPDARGKIQVGGPDNFSNMQVVSLYEQMSGRKAKVRHVPRPVLSIMSRLLRPFHPGLSQAMAAGLYFDVHGEAFDMTSTLQQYPMELTSLQEWVRTRVTGTGPS